MYSKARRALLATLPVAALAAVSLPATPVRAERKSPLAGQPAVRHRLLLVKKRFEAGLAFESSVNADFRHTVAGGLKLEFHLSDMWSVGAAGFVGTSFNTGLTDRVVNTLPDMGSPPTPARFEFEEHLNEMPIHGAAFASVTPWYGKLAAFGKFFVNFDFYFQGGVAFAMLENNCCSFTVDPTPGETTMDGDGNTIFPDDNPNNDDPLNSGSRVGLYLGGGIHVFINEWLALDFTVRDYLFSDNPSGLDFDADLAVTDDDSRFLNHLFLGVGLSFFLPTAAERTP